MLRGLADDGEVWAGPGPRPCPGRGPGHGVNAQNLRQIQGAYATAFLAELTSQFFKPPKQVILTKGIYIYILF